MAQRLSSIGSAMASGENASGPLLHAVDFGSATTSVLHRPVPRAEQYPRSSREQRADELETLAYELTVAETRERERIARELHDEIGQLLTIAKLKLGELQDGIHPSQNSLLADLDSLLTEAARATRALTYDLSCPVLQIGLNEAFESVALRVSRYGGAQMCVEGRVPVLPIAEPVLMVLLRVVRELSLNVQKHASARTASIRPRCAGSMLSITVIDDGVGFDTTASQPGFSRDGGFGLPSARAQMKAIGGWLELESAPGSGTRASAVLPLSR